MKRVLTHLILLIAIAQPTWAETKCSLGNDKTLCLIGNSITQAGTYHLILQAYHATRHPNERVTFISCGTGGDTATNIADRMEQDILIHNPDCATLMTGMNDMNADLFAPDIVVDKELKVKRKECLEAYKANTTALVERLTESGVELTLFTPTIYDQTAQIKNPAYWGKCDALLDCAKHIRSLSRKYNTRLVELTPIMLKINKMEQRKEPSFTIVGADRVHPGDVGHFVMAHQIISATMGSEIVSNVEIDAKKGRVTVSENCEVEYMGGDKGIAFCVEAKALPFPIKESFKPALKYVPFVERNNQERLKIGGLKADRYTLSIEGTVVDTLSRKELSRGVNLATNPRTPQYQQAEKIFDLCTQYNLRQAKLRTIANVDYKGLNGYQGAKDDIDAMRTYLDELNEKSRGKSWYEFAKKKNREYFKIKPLQASYWVEMDELREQIYNQNSPTKLHYELHEIE